MDYEQFAAGYYESAKQQAIQEFRSENLAKSQKTRANIVKELFTLSNEDLVLLSRELMFADEMLAEKLSDFIRVQIQDEDIFE